MLGRKKGKEKTHVPYLAEPLIVPITEDPIILRNDVAEEEGGLPQ